MLLLSPYSLGPRTAPNRVMFGPHVTNLGNDDRALTDRHVAYYERRASGGCGTIVVEGASVHPSDWPYERAPLAENCGDGWARIAEVCRPHGSLVIASLDHAGGQGSSAYSQAPLWAPSRVPEVNSREVPKWMEAEDIRDVIDGFADAARRAAESDLDGVEINAGQHSLVRQFLSGLTNQRDDEWGQTRTLFATRVITATRAALGSTRILGLRLSCDELAPWAGITPEMAPDITAELISAGIDYVVVTRGAIFSAEKTRPDFHEPEGFNIDLCRTISDAIDIPVILQGSVVDPNQAEWALGGFDDPAACLGVEMTRAQIADPDLTSKMARSEDAQVRPCTRCNQACQVRDARNPIVTCISEPTSGRETEDPDWYFPAANPRDVVIVGAGPAGLEAARVATIRGHRVTVVEQSDHIGGLARLTGPNVALIEWYEREHARLGTTIILNADLSDANVQALIDSAELIQCTGSKQGVRTYDLGDQADSVPVFDIVTVRRDHASIPDSGMVVVFDPIGGPIAIALAEELGERAVLITQDNIAGNELARTGDLAPANSRLAQQGVTVERRSLLRSVGPDGVTLEDRFSGKRRTINCVAVVDCGFRLPSDPIEGAAMQVGDAVAPRTVYEAVLEGRRAGLAI
jgi:mycofactocin system FadH/OYE family oxidoreductase 1